MKKGRDSRIELLRIFSMILIVISHFSLEMASYWKNSGTPADAIRILYFDVLGQPGAIVFFMISGYFFFYKDDFEKQKNKAKNQILKIWGKTIFYSIAVLIFIYFVFKHPTLKQSVTAILPFSFNEYWFVTCYLILILFSPWINKLINIINLKSFSYLLLGLFILMFPALLNGGIINNMLLAISGYLTGAYIKQFRDYVDKLKNWQLSIILIVDYLIMLLSIFVSRTIGISIFHSAHFTHFPLSYIMAICIFLLFLRMKSFSNKYINILASGTFAVYLITVQPLMVPFLWDKIVNVNLYQNMGIVTPFLIIGISIIIYLVCALLDICLTKIFHLVRAGIKY